MSHKDEPPKWLKKLLDEKEVQLKQLGRTAETDKWRGVLGDLKSEVEAAYAECNGDPKSEKWAEATRRFAEAIKAHVSHDGDVTPYL